MDQPTQELHLGSGLGKKDGGAVEWRLAVRQQATRQKLKTTLLHPRTTSTARGI